MFCVYYQYVRAYLKYIMIFLIEGTCSYHLPSDHTSSACIWNGKNCDSLMFLKTQMSTLAGSWQALLFELSCNLCVVLQHQQRVKSDFSLCVGRNQFKLHTESFFKKICAMYVCIYPIIFCYTYNAIRELLEFEFYRTVLWVGCCMFLFCFSLRYLLRLELLL